MQKTEKAKGKKRIQRQWRNWFQILIRLFKKPEMVALNKNLKKEANNYDFWGNYVRAILEMEK